MELVNNYVNVLKNYTGFSGRARRREYWLFVLANYIVSVVIQIIGSAVHLSWLGLIYTLAVLCPSIAVCIRRPHDIGKSGWYYLMCLIPLAGVFIVLYYFVQDSDPDTNEYGPNPKANE